MKDSDFSMLVNQLKGKKVERPNKKEQGTLSGHAAGEPFEKLAYHILKEKYPDQIFKQYEYLNSLFLNNPAAVSVNQRQNLFNSPVVMHLLWRGERATKEWSINKLFEEKQNDTADILWYNKNVFDIIDIKTRNKSKDAQPPNIISCYKLAQACALMLDNNDFDSIDIHYVEVNWVEDKNNLVCSDAVWKDLFKADPTKLYINWAAAMQVQFHVCDLDQSFTGTKEEWAKTYLKNFVFSAEKRCKKMYATFVTPFSQYIENNKREDTLF